MKRDNITRTGEPTVAYETAVQRVRARAGATGLLASSIAGLIWPKHRMKAQGAAFAAGPFIRRMLDEGVLSYDHDGGYRICAAAEKAPRRVSKGKSANCSVSRAVRADARARAAAKSDPHAHGCPDAPGICECFSRRSAS